MQEHATFTADSLEKIPGLKVVRPQGAMYVMTGIETSHFKDVADDVDFAKMLLAEENVLVLPGSAFSVPNFVRIVFCAPKDKLKEAFDRIAHFCAVHAA
jgi:tyrosine aminotransferase